MTEPAHPTPSEEHRKGDSQFIPVVIAAGVFLLLALGVAILIVSGWGKKLIPKRPNPHPVSQTLPQVPPAPQAPPPSQA